jgi:enediyne polyketide synthase
MNHPAIAIVGMACRFPDARSPEELWENALAQRRAFRRMPSQRLRLEDYPASNPGAQDGIGPVQAAVIEGYEFDRVGFRVSGDTYRSVDLAHWLALDVASQALADAGYPEGLGLRRDTTGVFVGNTLVGEFSRANVMRMRWPYVRRVVEATLADQDCSLEQRRTLLEGLETRYKAPFPPVGEETLAGSLSNTIAGRICNHFDLKGGGYAVDGACASSLLAVVHACSALAAGDLDEALAGGVDLSLDPFELMGFAKIGALASEEMRVYDARSAGFWPGEGCGFVVLMPYETAVAQHRNVYAVIRGWGISSDGTGGITRPEAEGQLLALQRAYRRAGFGIETVPYFEGHGTGTSVGDATELRALSRARRLGAPGLPPAAIGSIKANMGHTKAAAGVAGLIKATLALHHQVLPPTTGCDEPHPELLGAPLVLRVLKEGALWPADLPLRAGVSAMGFGGINAHLALEGVAAQRSQGLGPQERTLLRSPQDAELFLLSAPDHGELQRQVQHLSALAPGLSLAELADLSAHMASRLKTHPARAAVVASTPAQLTSRLETLRVWLESGVTARLRSNSGVFLGQGLASPHIAYLFPGQGSPIYGSGGAWSRRFPWVHDLYTQRSPGGSSNGAGTAVAQPAVVTASLAALHTLERLGIHARAAVGHSLGELTAMHWAGALDEETLLRIAEARGRIMAELADPGGAMASIAASQDEVKALLVGKSAFIAGLNAPHQTVISGTTAAVNEVLAKAQEKGLRSVLLPVSHAFHSPLVAAALPALAEQLSQAEFRPVQRIVISTVTGSPIAPDDDLRELLLRQVTAPVRFMEAVATAAAARPDLLIEAGPGQVLSGIVAESRDTPVIALDAGGPSLKGLLQAVGAAFVLGAAVRLEALFAGRFTRAFDPDRRPQFFVNPCELAPLPAAEAGNDDRSSDTSSRKRDNFQDLTDSPPHPHTEPPLELVRQLVAERTELPLSAVKASHRLLSDLHLNSITVSQLVMEAARHLGLPPPVAPLDFADATVAQAAQALEDLVRTGGQQPVGAQHQPPPGVDSWVRAFTVELIERTLPHRPPPTERGAWLVVAHPDHPLAGPLEQAFATCAGSGVVVCLPPEPDESHVGLLLEGARGALAGKDPTRFVLVQHGRGAAAFARTLHLESPEIITCVVNVPTDHPRAPEWVVAEAMAAAGYSEAHYDSSGRRLEPVLRLLPSYDQPGKIPLGESDVLLVTGGGKGIAAECALALARQTGVRLALMGRSQISADPELSANLDQMSAAGVRFQYVAADVTDAGAVRTAIHQVETDLGQVTAILHGAGTNTPQPIRTLDEAAFLNTLAPKVQGARNVLAAVDPEHLRLFITFGSIIARTGLKGEADYAVANEWLTHLTECWQKEHPGCRCLAVEWSIWSGVGMGQRLGRVDALVQQGITPITVAEGVGTLCRLLAAHGQGAAAPAPVSLVVTGRFGEPPTLGLDRPGLPLSRFLEWPRVYYPGVELVADTELSVATDPYLDDHVFRGNRLFPAVMGLEAMAQAAMALAGTNEVPTFEDVEFSRAVVVPNGPSVRIRVAALKQGRDCVEVVLRSEETRFQLDHFRAKCRFGVRTSEDKGRPCLFLDRSRDAIPILNAERDLYGGILFHKDRFRRLGSYWMLGATECLAEIVADIGVNWFSSYLPADLVLGDPAARDAGIHAIQACIPHATLLPVGVDRIVLGAAQTNGPRFVHAQEKAHKGDTFTYDLEVADADGRLQERWEGLRLRSVGAADLPSSWVGPLLGPYIERRVQELIHGSKVAARVDKGSGAERRVRTERAIERALGKGQVPCRLPDGKREVEGACAVSVAHAGDLTLVVAGPGPIGCDAEPVVAKSTAIWQDLLGLERFTLAGVAAYEAGEDFDSAATRVWATGECLKKAGLQVNTPLVLSSVELDHWVLFKAGQFISATLVAQVQGAKDPLAIAVLSRSNDARL